ncbi:DUF1579 family protein [Falsiroseomonas sp. HW251]|uniref:DUF1579 family protein n=1 Tax=Falsiroseomonas sp. HW251 TaxID=3390998 RepID=UPI003D323547
MDTHVAGHTLGMTRLVPASPEEVFAAWTQPDRIKAWFGGRSMTCPEASVDLRPGGLHRTVVRDADGTDYANPMLIEAVDAPGRLVLRIEEGSACPLPGAVGTLLFLPDPLGTRFEVRWDHPTEAMRRQHEEMGFERLWGETIDKLGAHAATGPAGCPFAAPPTPDHGWLHRLLGEWRFETECVMPGGDVQKASGVERVRSLGAYWVVGESEGSMPGGGQAKWIVTMGFDVAAQRFRGTFVGSMMPHMFVYDGALEADGRTLTLDTEGPAMDRPGMARFQDIVTMLGDDERTLISRVQGPDGSWTQIMSSRFQRIG